MNYTNYLKRKSGFTLIELLVVIAIIGILVTIVVVAIDPVKLIGESRDAKKREELQQLKNALQLYYNDNNSYPDDATILNDLTLPNPPYTRSMPDEYVYDDVPPGEYRAGVGLDYPDTDDAQTKTACSNYPAGWIGVSDDYVVCPD